MIECACGTCPHLAEAEGPHTPSLCDLCEAFGCSGGSWCDRRAKDVDDALDDLTTEQLASATVETCDLCGQGHVLVIRKGEERHCALPCDYDDYPDGEGF